MQEQLPTGTVTFLFTDIEGSTKLWEYHSREMQGALARHDFLLRQAIENYGGSVFKTVGDSFWSVFTTPADALNAALAAQHALLAEDWGDEICSIKARMALHSGAAEARAGDYFGQTLNRVARLLSAGHGGQTLLSLAACELVRDELPPGVELRDMGERRLKDLIRPEHVFQVVAPGLPNEFPPLRTLDNRPTNLPAQATSVIGRDQEVAAVCELVRRPNVRLLTLSGPGGTGKTRLALQAAADLLDDFENGVFFVALAPIGDAALVTSTIAQTLGVKEISGQSQAVSLKNWLRDKQLLLVLDNFEQVVAAAPQVADLLAAVPSLKIVVTSRAVLRVYGEQEFQVPPLSVPDLKRLPRFETLSQYAAVALFIQRAQAVKPNFSVNNENAPAIAEICTRLDGLPLAIELAAARIKVLTPQLLLERLGNRLKLLTREGGRDLPLRQQTLRNAIAWSYDLLDEDEKKLFARLAVFVGGATLAAAEAVVSTDEADPLDNEVLDGIMSLLDKSLLKQVEGVNNEPRFVMLETIREFALERLTESNENTILRDSHANFFLTVALEAQPKITGPEQEMWLNKLEQEHDNFRAAMRASLESGAIERGLRQAAALWWFWYSHGHLSEGRRWLIEALQKADSSSAVTLPASSFLEARAEALRCAGAMTRWQGQYEQAISIIEESVTIWRKLGKKAGLARALNSLGAANYDHGNYERAKVCNEESLLYYLETGNMLGVGIALTTLGDVAVAQRDYDKAIATYQRSLAMKRQSEDKLGIAFSLMGLGRAARYQGNFEDAIGYYQESLHTRQTIGDKLGIAECLEGLASSERGLGHNIKAARLFGASEALRELIGAPLPLADRTEYNRNLAAMSTLLDESVSIASWAEGRAMSLEQAIEYALEDSRQASVVGP